MLMITGAGGFLGGHLKRVFDDLCPLCPTHRQLDLLDGPAVLDFVRTNGVKEIVHAAGYVGGIGLHIARPGRVATENLRMGLNVLDAAAACDARVVMVSTVCIYPENAPVPTPERCMHDGYPARDTAPYGIAKRTLHVVAQAMRSENGLRFLTIVPTNLYGPGDHYDEDRSHVVPALIRRAHEARERGDPKLVVWGDGSQVRDLLYVCDCAQAIRNLLRLPLDGEVVNLGSTRATSIRTLAETVCEVVGYRGELTFDASKPAGAPVRLLDTSNAASLFGYQPPTSLIEGVRAAYQDFLQTQNGELR